MAKLTATDAAAATTSAFSVAIDGDTVVIGAYDDDGGSSSGAAYVFRTSDGGATYDQVAKLTASDAARERPLRLLRGDRRQHHRGRGLLRNDGTTGSVYVSARRRRRHVRPVAKLTAADARVERLLRHLRGDRRQHRRGGATGRRLRPPGSVYVFRTSDGGATYARWPS